MLPTKQVLTQLVELGLSDDQIVVFFHENTKPADLYGAVAEVVTGILHGDAEVQYILDNAAPDSPLGKFADKLRLMTTELDEDVCQWWRDMGITRSDTKKIVMTYLYGSTEYGNRDSINERIEKRAEECMEKSLDPYFDRQGADVWKEHRTKAVTVMVRLTRGAMAIVCPSTVEQMDRFQEWAFDLGAQDKTFKVKSPLNFLMVQDNPNVELRQVKLRDSKGKHIMSMNYYEPTTDGKILNERKMKAGAAPNGIHLHDAAHLQDATVRCDSEYFHHIHDSMATQCADTPNLAHSIRESFNWMYGDDEDGMPKDIMQEIYDLNNGDECGLREPDPMGSLDLQDVHLSRYFFS